jgi:hypothetical protein
MLIRYLSPPERGGSALRVPARSGRQAAVRRAPLDKVTRSAWPRTSRSGPVCHARSGPDTHLISPHRARTGPGSLCPPPKLSRCGDVEY